MLHDTAKEPNHNARTCGFYCTEEILLFRSVPFIAQGVKWSSQLFQMFLQNNSEEN